MWICINNLQQSFFQNWVFVPGGSLKRHHLTNNSCNIYKTSKASFNTIDSHLSNFPPSSDQRQNFSIERPLCDWTQRSWVTVWPTNREITLDDVWTKWGSCMNSSRFQLFIPGLHICYMQVWAVSVILASHLLIYFLCDSWQKIWRELLCSRNICYFFMLQFV